MSKAWLGKPFHDRFVLRERLGAGGMGMVYAAHDLERDEMVALKTLHHRDPAALYAFKKEFRALADVAHPNLVSLYELFADGDEWFFTMELIDGESFIDHVRPAEEASPRRERRVDAALTETLPLTSLPSSDRRTAGRRADPVEGGETPGDGCDEGRLRPALQQLVLGVRACHNAGRVHRDLKPQNVLVTRGRVVILDFGIARELAPALSQATAEAGLPGTLGYMAPEQARGEECAPASDWYAVGVMLFEALTGSLPFSGSVSQVLSGKLYKTAPSPASLVSGLPRDLVELCEDLLARDPAGRPSVAGILGRLGGVDTGSPGGTALRIGAREEGPLVGREAHLETLEAAFRKTLDGHPVAVHVHGTSGMGKTAVVHHFLRRLIERSLAVVLPGRCYVNELVLYKALDGVVDSLSRYLKKLPRQEVERLLPRETPALARVFPVLSRVDAIATASRAGHVGSDRLTVRRRAFEALRELFGRIAEQQPVVLYIDDLHWADADSAALLSDLLRPPDPPPLLLVTCFRSEEIGSQGFLADLVSLRDRAESKALAVEPLAEADAVALTRALLGHPKERELLVSTIVREARGSPFLVEQLADYARAGDVDLVEAGLDNRVSLAEMLEMRLRQLPPGAEDLLLVLAAAGRPLDAAVAYRAAGLDGDERPLVAALQAANLVRSSGSAEAVELYHDRIRESLAGRADAERARRIHLRLASTLVACGRDDPETLFTHYRSAGETGRAAEQAALAARKASAALAFDRAALFYHRALELGREGGERRELRRGLAESLANAGRPADAASAFLELAARSTGVEALRLRSRAAQEYLAGGYFDRGFAVLGTVLEAVGLKLPETFRGALLSLAWQRLRLRLRGLGYSSRDAATLPEEELLRIDTCYTVAAGLVTADTVRGADFQTRHLRLALGAGEPLRVARALGLEASYLATAGTRVRRRARRLLDATFELARTVDDPFVTGLGHLHAGLLAYCLGEWREAIEECDAAAGILTDHCTGAMWEITYARRYGLAARMQRGEVAAVSRRLPRLLAEAAERGNVFAAANLQTRFGIAWLAADDPDRCRWETDKALESWSRQGFQVVHYNGLISHCLADLYVGDGAGAHRRLLGQWPTVQRSLVSRIQLSRIEGLFLRGGCALAAAAAGGDRRRSLRLARRAASRIAREPVAYGPPMVDQVRAGIARLAGDETAAGELLRRAADGFAAADMHLYAAAARWRHGELTAGDGGEAERRTAEGWLREQGVRRPDRMVAMLAPGFASPRDV